MGELRFAEFGATLRWHEQGSGRPMVVLPALSVPVMSVFAEMIREPELADRRLILIDYLGSGASDHPVGFDYGLAAHARSVAGVLEGLGLEAVDVLGHSMGGSVAIQLAMDHPRLVGRLGIGEGNLAPGGGATSSRIMRFERDAFVEGGCAALEARLREVGSAWLADGWESADPAGVWGNAAALVGLDPGFGDAFLSMDLPRTFIFGEASLAEGLAPDVPSPAVLENAGVRVAVIPGAGHAMFLDNPGACAREVAEAFPTG
jgi:pimeloyl-ACP methyl ester carboxylesterase